MQTTENTIISFGDFELDPVHRRLMNCGRPVALKSKAFDLLLALIEDHGQVVSKNDLLDRVWKDQFVEENNLTVHIAALRKALGEGKSDNSYIVTVPGTGYKFVAQIRPSQTTEVTVESRSFERVVIEEEIEVETGEQKTSSNKNVSETLREPKTSVSPINRGRIALKLIIASVFLGLIGGTYVLWPRISARFASTSPFSNHTTKQLTTNGKVGLATLSPDGKLFAYTIDDLGRKSLWLGYAEGGNHIELFSADEISYRAITFSPDGKDLLFSTCSEKNPGCSLFKMPAFGGVQTRLNDGIGNFALSPDGRSIATARRDKESAKDIVSISSLDGTAKRDVAFFSTEQSFRFETISWSADGNLLALSAQKDTEIASDEIAVIDIATGIVSRIEHESLREITKTAWLSDGSALIVTAIKPESDSSVPQYVVYSVGYPGGEVQAVTTDRSNYGASWHNDAGVSISLSAASDALLAVEHRQLSNVWVAPSDDLSAPKQITFGSFGKYDGLWGMDWTPDGRLIYTTSDTQSQFLSQMNSDGSEQKQITAPVGYDSVLTVTQDGRYIVFHSDRASTIDIWRTDIDGTNPLQLTFGGKGFHPAPSPDGKWVYYRSTLYGSGRLCRVPIDGGEPEILNDKETAWISFSPDGKYFAAHYVTDTRRLAIFSTETNEVVRQFDLPKTGTLFMGSRWTPDSLSVAYRDASQGYWLQPISGGDPAKMEGLPNEKLYNFSWSKDGNQFAFVRGQEIRDIVLIRSNVN